MMRSIRCVSVAATLATRSERALTPAMERHVEDCFRCRRERLLHRSLVDELARRRHVELVAPSDTLGRVMTAIGPWEVDAVQERPKRRIAAAAAVATAAATAAAGSAMIVLRYRHRAA